MYIFFVLFIYFFNRIDMHLTVISPDIKWRCGRVWSIAWLEMCIQSKNFTEYVSREHQKISNRNKIKKLQSNDSH